jgi:hypothetical protein
MILEPYILGKWEPFFAGWGRSMLPTVYTFLCVLLVRFRKMLRIGQPIEHRFVRDISTPSLAM